MAAACGDVLTGCFPQIDDELTKYIKGIVFLYFPIKETFSIVTNDMLYNNLNDLLFCQ